MTPLGDRYTFVQCCYLYMGTTGVKTSLPHVMTARKKSHNVLLYFLFLSVVDMFWKHYIFYYQQKTQVMRNKQYIILGNDEVNQRIDVREL